MNGATQAEAPWCDCKVAFAIDDHSKFERWAKRTNWGEKLLPPGWTMCEIDGSGARTVAIFRIETMPDNADGERVFALLAKVGGYRRKS